MADPALIALQVRAEAMCVAGFFFAVGGVALAWVSAAFADSRRATPTLEDIARATVMVVCAPAFVAGVIVFFVNLPNAAAPVPPTTLAPTPVQETAK